jgi:DNA-binding MarR family transcriptional regulator
MADPDYAALLRFRVALRRFNRWSEAQAAAVGLTHSQHQLLLVVKAHPDRRGPTVGEAADLLLIRQQSAVELASRTEALGFLVRARDDRDGRVVRLQLTAAGEAAIHALTAAHLSELKALGPRLRPVLDEPRAEKR